MANKRPAGPVQAQQPAPTEHSRNANFDDVKSRSFDSRHGRPDHMAHGQCGNGQQAAKVSKDSA